MVGEAGPEQLRGPGGRAALTGSMSGPIKNGDGIYSTANPLALQGHRGHRLPPAHRAAAGHTSTQTILRLSERAEPLLRRFWRAQEQRFTDAFFGRSAATTRAASPLSPLERRAAGGRGLGWEEWRVRAGV